MRCSSVADKTNAAWEAYLNANPWIEQKIIKSGFCEVTADSIKKFREPRLMTKHDSNDGVPKPLSDRGLNVLSASRRSYYLGDLEVFEAFPDTSGLKPEFCDLPGYETLDIEHISSESNAINALVIGGILDRFLNEYDTVETFSGRMGTGSFGFEIARRNGTHAHLDVKNAQLEIDGGFENDHSVIIMEAKNVIHSDFNVRQLYYPFRKYSSLVSKPIRLVFSQYTNLTYNLFEYEFTEPMDFSSIRLLQMASYTFEEDNITADDVWWTWNNTKVLYSDDYRTSRPIPFPQADKIDRIFALMEFLSGYPDGASTDKITEFMGTVERQAAYYPSAGIYLGLFERPRKGMTALTKRALELLGFKRRSDRLLKLASFIFEHKIFHDLYGMSIKNGSIPEKQEIVHAMSELYVIKGTSDSMLYRRASTVAAWLKWLFDLPNDD